MGSTLIPSKNGYKLAVDVPKNPLPPAKNIFPVPSTDLLTKSYLILSLLAATGTGRQGIRVQSTVAGLPGDSTASWTLYHMAYQGSAPTNPQWETLPINISKVGNILSFDYTLTDALPLATHRFYLSTVINGKQINYTDNYIVTPADTVFVDTTDNKNLLNDMADDYVISLQDQAQLRIFLANQKFLYETLYAQIYAKTGSDTFIAGNILGGWRESVWKPSYQYFAALCYQVPGWASDVAGYNGSQTYDSKGSVNLGGTPTQRTTAYTITNMNGYQALKNGLLNTVLGMQKDYNALPATTSYVGMVQVDGTTIHVDANGVISSTVTGGGGATGATGPAGPQGLTGATGPQGIPGTNASGGTVTQVNTVYPLIGGPITGNGSISLNKANATTDGYLSSSDWTNFTGKTSNVGTVTNVSFVQNNGFYAEITNPTSTPSMTLHTDITGILKGDGYGMSAATAADLANKIGYTGYFQPVFSVNSNGFIKISTGNVISYDNNTYSQTNHNHSGTYQPVLSGNGFVTINGSVIGYDNTQYLPLTGGVNLTGGFGLNDQKLFLRTNSDTNHYIWNAADDWEEIVAFSGTGLRVSNSAGTALLKIDGTTGDSTFIGAIKTGTGLNTTSTTGSSYSATSNASEFIGLTINQNATGRANILLSTSSKSGYISLAETGDPNMGQNGAIALRPNGVTTLVASPNGCVNVRSGLDVGYSSNGAGFRVFGSMLFGAGMACGVMKSDSPAIAYKFFSGNGVDTNYIYTGASGLLFRNQGDSAQIASLSDAGVFDALQVKSNGSNVITTANVASYAGSTINGTGFVKASGTTISYDNSTYITSSGSISGNASTASLVTTSLSGTAEQNLVYATMADNDFFRIRVGGAATNAGWAEIATADDATEPIYVSQYTGVFSSLTRRATLLDGSGNTSFPGTITGSNFITNGNYYLVNGNTSLTQGAGYSQRVITNSGYVDIGPQNTGFCHFETDRPIFYFSKHTTINGPLSIYGTNVSLDSSGFHGNLSGTATNFDTGSGCYSSGTNIVVGGDVYSNNVYTNGWFRNYGHTGIYNQDFNTHFYADGSSYWRMSSNNGLILNTTSAHDSAIAGYLYHDAAGFGLLNNAGSWSIRVYPSTSGMGGELSGNWNVSGVVTATNFKNGYQTMNLDTIKTPGLYHYDGGISGSQPLGTDWYNLKTIEIGADNRYSQFVMPYNNNRIFYRHKQDSGWSGYDELITTGNLTSQSIFHYQGFTLDANTMDSNSSGFTYSVNAPHTGPITRFSAGGGYDLELNSTYSGGGDSLSFRTRNGDVGSWNGWNTVIHSDNIGSQSVNYASSAGSAGSATNATNLSNSGDAGYIGTLHCSNWIRTSGSSGWYNETYATGIHSDASGNVKTYNGGSLEATGNADAGGLILRDESGNRYRIYVYNGQMNMVKL